MIALVPQIVEDIDISRQHRVTLVEFLKESHSRILQVCSVVFVLNNTQDFDSSFPFSELESVTISLLKSLRVGIFISFVDSHQAWVSMGISLSDFSQRFPQLFRFILSCLLTASSQVKALLSSLPYYF